MDGIRNDARHHYSSGKCKSKPKTANAVEDMEQLKLPNIVDGNTELWKHLGKHFGSLLKNWSYTYCVTQLSHS